MCAGGLRTKAPSSSSTSCSPALSRVGSLPLRFFLAATLPPARYRSAGGARAMQAPMHQTLGQEGRPGLQPSARRPRAYHARHTFERCQLRPLVDVIEEVHHVLLALRDQLSYGPELPQRVGGELALRKRDVARAAGGRSVDNAASLAEQPLCEHAGALREWRRARVAVRDVGRSVAIMSRCTLRCCASRKRLPLRPCGCSPAIWARPGL